jgi:hypothetical protein
MHSHGQRAADESLCARFNCADAASPALGACAAFGNTLPHLFSAYCRRDQARRSHSGCEILIVLAVEGLDRNDRRRRSGQGTGLPLVPRALAQTPSKLH